MNSLLLEKNPEPKEMCDERYFQIRDIGSDGCGLFLPFCVKKEATLEEIGEIASEEMTNEKIRQEKWYLGFPSFPTKPPHWRATIKVVELKRETKKLEEINERTGRDYKNVWKTKRKGLKFTITNNWIEMKMLDGSVYSGNGYSFGKKV